MSTIETTDRTTVIFIVAFDGEQTWERVSLEIPADAIPERFVPGSAKWTSRVVAWYRDTQPSAGVAYVGVLSWKRSQ